jgi:hypothetical protein
MHVIINFNNVLPFFFLAPSSSNSLTRQRFPVRFFLSNFSVGAIPLSRVKPLSRLISMQINEDLMKRMMLGRRHAEGESERRHKTGDNNLTNLTIGKCGPLLAYRPNQFPISADVLWGFNLCTTDEFPFYFARP